MIITSISREEAKEQFNKYLAANEVSDVVFNKLNSDYLELRKDLLNIESECQGKEKYEFDLLFAKKLYEYFAKKDYFNINIAGDIGFWRYLCTFVVPDLIERRHGLVARYYYEKNGALYLQAMWWYFHMGFQVDSQTTYNMLRKLNTDYIMQIVERQGKDGFYLDVYREIIRVICSLPDETRKKLVGGSSLFGRVLIQNTAKQDNYNLTVDGKSNIYVCDLFSSCKVEVSCNGKE